MFWEGSTTPKGMEKQRTPTRADDPLPSTTEENARALREREICYVPFHIVLDFAARCRLVGETRFEQLPRVPAAICSPQARCRVQLSNRSAATTICSQSR